jgi:hypothetical protein
MADPFLAIAYPVAQLPHVGGGPMPGGGGPVDPGYGQGHPVPPHVGGGPIYRPPHVGGGPAPGQPPTDPGYGQGHPLPPHVGGGPATPPGHPDQGLPGGGGVVMPPIYYPPTVWPPEGQPKPEGDILLLAWVPNVGLAWIVVDTDLVPSNELPKPPVHVGGGPAQPPGAPTQPIAPTPAPKT